ncbi:hypothetical protein MVES1_002496 [Malassezia vespertilionis]|uniref:Mob1p n=1 Tax=Malassezia vespertilionis TaxID=2020962 RepID=A0A2N1JA13_9BASI|nr:uncharacterized protein MVES1_002496 [Malassezia vespertilionis]PKI83385.1 hypothetical protein MVES_002355 [Malassezia vespertilionis]WFD07139.1 hypothetical protein MVES1_002496 [Malassezia vespertilionis]
MASRPRRGEARADVDAHRVHHQPLGVIQKMPYGAQEYIVACARTDPHNTLQIVTDPPLQGAPAFREEVWIYGQLVCLVQDMNVPWIVRLQSECGKGAHQDTCEAMHVGADVYLCPSHGDSRPCTAMEYILHSLDTITAQLCSPQHFPGGAYVPHESVRLFYSMSKQLARIFLHIQLHHGELFAEAEATSSLYARFRMLVEMYDLYPVEELPVQ